MLLTDDSIVFSTQIGIDKQLTVICEVNVSLLLISDYFF